MPAKTHISLDEYGKIHTFFPNRMASLLLSYFYLIFQCCWRSRVPPNRSVPAGEGLHQDLDEKKRQSNKKKIPESKKMLSTAVPVDELKSCLAIK